MKLYGIAYRHRMGVNENAIDLDHVAWEDTKHDAIAEYNQRDDKHWDAALIAAEVKSIEILHDTAWQPTAPWDRAYEGTTTRRTHEFCR